MSKHVTGTLIFSVFFLLMLSGCGDPTVDGSSQEAMEESIENIRDSLPESQHDDFNQALTALAFSEIGDDIFSGNGPSQSEIESLMRDRLAGMTGDEILSEGDRIIQERKERERRQALKEIEELRQKQGEAEEAQQMLSDFEVIRSRFYFQEQRYGRDKPIIELTVRNGTEHAVSRAYFSGTIASPDRSVPWVEDTFNYSIPGGLEPGEEATWHLAPNQFSDWGRVEAPEDAVFTVVPSRLDGPSGDPVLSAEGLSDYDRRRLERLKEQYGVE